MQHSDFVSQLQNIAASIGHRGLTLARVRAALAQLRKDLQVDAECSVDQLRERRLADAIGREFTADLTTALATRAAANSEDEIHAAQAAIKKAWGDMDHRVLAIWDEVCSEPPKTAPGRPTY
jgi:hypothetical protein